MLVEKIKARLHQDHIIDSEGKKWSIVYQEYKDPVCLVEHVHFGHYTCGVFWGDVITIHPLGFKYHSSLEKNYLATTQGWQEVDSGPPI